MKFGNKVRSIRLLGGYRHCLASQDGFIAELDLWPLFEHPRGPMAERFQQQSFFHQVYLDHGTVSWPNGYDICSDVLRYYCKQGRVTFQEEMNAYFDPESAAKADSPRVLKNKPMN